MLILSTLKSTASRPLIYPQLQDESAMKNGYVLKNNNGQFAKIVNESGFSQDCGLEFVDDINEAHLFPSDSGNNYGCGFYITNSDEVVSVSPARQREVVELASS